MRLNRVQIRGLLGNRGKVAIGLSGGVDSAVSAYLLKQSGFEVIGVHMSNWNDDDHERIKGNSRCEGQDALLHARLNAESLEIPLHRVSFEEDYWNEVFEPCLREFQRGTTTPNPDVLCNRIIKFDRFVKFAREKFSVDWVATGHYARIGQDLATGKSRLFAGLDSEKNQSYFLSMVERHKFDRVLFPVGELTKNRVRSIAEELELPSAQRKSSAGLCFVGKKKRNFSDFLAEYIPEQDQKNIVEGNIVDCSTGEIIGRHSGLWKMTIGQRARIGGRNSPCYVIGKCVDTNSMFVVDSLDSELAKSNAILVENFNLIPHLSQIEFDAENEFRSKFQHQYPGKLFDCTVKLLDSSSADENLKFLIVPDEPISAIAPGQVLALYSNDQECLGGGIIQSSTNTNLHFSNFMPTPLIKARNTIEEKKFQK
jgi:tRNA-specific 2-thiouridylase